MAEVKRTSDGTRKVSILAKGLGGEQAKVGWFKSAYYLDGTPVAYIAMIMELGYRAKNIPPRSFMRTTIMAQRRKWAQMISHGAQGILAGTILPSTAMELLASTAAGDMRKKITQIWTPALKPGTIKNRIRRMASYANLKTRKGKAAHVNRKYQGAPKSLTKPLVDTGFMLDTLNYTLEK